MTAWSNRRLVVVAGTTVAAPLVLAAIVLLWRPWTPVLDMAMTELRVRDVGGRHTPLVGLPGRIGDFPDQGSHPGPWSFYLVAPFHRLAGSAAWGMELASVVINSVCAAAIVALGARRFGTRGAIVFAALVAVAVRGYGLTVLTHPWNPYFPVLIWLLALVAAWFVLLGDRWLAVVVVAATTIAAQTHVPYLVSAIALDALVVGWLGWAAWRDRTRPADEPRRGDRHRLLVAPLVVMFATGGLLWLPPLVEQLRGGSGGNVAKLVRHFATDPPEEPIGVGSAARLVTQHVDLAAIARELVTRDDAFVHRAGQVGALAWGGLVVLVAWGAAVVAALVWRHRALLALHAVVAVALAAGTVSIARIFGKVWFYLTLWMSGTALLLALSLAWTGVELVARARPATANARPVTTRLVTTVATATVVVTTALSLVAAFDHRAPEENLGDDVRAILPAVTAALDADVGAASGRDGSYVVFWQESVVPGAQGYALLNELERRGYRVGVHPTWRVPATPHRVRRDGEFDAEIHLVSGSWIDVWRTRPDHVEVATYDGRTDAERERFDELEQRVEQRLVAIGRDDLLDIVATNLFGASLVPGLPADIVADLGEMLLLGEPVAVFVAPAGSTF